MSPLEVGLHCDAEDNSWLKLIAAYARIFKLISNKTKENCGGSMLRRYFLPFTHLIFLLNVRIQCNNRLYVLISTAFKSMPLFYCVC